MLGDTQWLWLIALIGGPLLLAVLFARGLRQTSERRRNDPAGLARTERATHELYEEEEHRGEGALDEGEEARALEEARRRAEAASRQMGAGRR